MLPYLSDASFKISRANFH